MYELLGKKLDLIEHVLEVPVRAVSPGKTPHHKVGNEISSVGRVEAHDVLQRGIGILKP